MKVLVFARVDLVDAQKINEVLSKEKNITVCIVCIFIDEKEISYAEKKIVNTGWVGEKIGSELMASITRAFRQEAYTRADEIENALKSDNYQLRILIETGSESVILERLLQREKPDRVILFKQKRGWWSRFLRTKEKKYPPEVKIITVK